MKRNRFVAGFLSILVPGLGQIYGGKGSRGAAILAGAIIIGNLNVVFLLLFVSTAPDPASGWAYWLPRVVHDLLSVWSVVFWLWAVVDAYLQVREQP